MGKNNKKNEKTILTEDLFNAKGNAQVSDTILNESDDLKQNDDNLQNNNEDEVTKINNVEINQFIGSSHTLNSNDEELISPINNSDELDNNLFNNEPVTNIGSNDEITLLDDTQTVFNVNNENDNKEIFKLQTKEKKKIHVVKSIKVRGFNDEQYYK